MAAYLATQFTKALQKCHIDEKLKYGKGRVLFIKVRTRPTENLIEALMNQAAVTLLSYLCYA